MMGRFSTVRFGCAGLVVPLLLLRPVAAQSPGIKPAASVTPAASVAVSGVAPASPAGHTPLEVVPVKGFNFSADWSAQHNSATGWSNVVTPDLSYRFNRHFFVDANVPWYLDVKANVPTLVKGVVTYPLLTTHNVIGDASTAGHLEFQHKAFAELGTVTVAYNTGDAQYGLSARTTTYNFTSHSDYNAGPFDFDVELGMGNSSSLASTTIRKAYTAVGPMANFQAGVATDLPWSFNLDLEAYEDLPLASENVYGTVTRKNKKGVLVTRQVLEGKGLAEDNGFLAELDIPLGTHFLLNGMYSRSLIQALDTAGVGLTWTLRSPKIPVVH